MKRGVVLIFHENAGHLLLSVYAPEKTVMYFDLVPVGEIKGNIVFEEAIVLPLAKETKISFSNPVRAMFGHFFENDEEDRERKLQLEKSNGLRCLGKEYIYSQGKIISIISIKSKL